MNPVAPAAEFDEGGLDGLGDVDHPRLVDVPLELFLALVLHLEVVENAVAHDGDADLLGMGPVHEHHLLRALPGGDLFLLPAFLGLFLRVPQGLLGHGAFGPRRDLRAREGGFLRAGFGSGRLPRGGGRGGPPPPSPPAPAPRALPSPRTPGALSFPRPRRRLRRRPFLTTSCALTASATSRISGAASAGSSRTAWLPPPSARGAPGSSPAAGVTGASLSFFRRGPRFQYLRFFFSSV